MSATEPEGLLLVDKPVGPTSHDTVAAARRALGTRRIGHAGTLDPFASGLLVLLVGRATRLAEYVSDLPKSYRAVMRFGEATDTDDRTGQVIAHGATETLTPDRVRAALESQIGVRLQRPPAFSAKKVAGTRAYEAARQGRPLDLDPVPVRIDAIRVDRVELPGATFEVTCGAGTYVRAIARDAGEDLGVPAHLTELHRTAIGPFLATDAVRLDELAADPDPRRRLRPAARAVDHLPQVEVDETAARRIAHGVRLPAPASASRGPVAIVCGDVLVAVGEVSGGMLAPRKVMAHG